MIEVRPAKALLLAVMFASCVHAQDVPPPTAMTLDGVPPVPQRIATEVARYAEFKPTSFVGWHPVKAEMLVSRRYKNTPQIYRLAAPGGQAELLTDYPEPVRTASYQPTTGEYLVFGRDSGGNEVFRAFRRDMHGGEAAPITPEGVRVQSLSWSNDGKQICYTTVPVNRQGSDDKISTSLHVADPLKPGDARKLGELAGGGWYGFSFSPDDKQLVYLEYVSANESYLWLMDIASAKSRRLTDKHHGEAVSYSDVHFSRDGKGLYAVTDRDSEFRRLTYIELDGLKHTTLTPHIDWDISGLDLSRDGALLAFVANEDGTNVLHLMRTADHKALPAPRLPQGTIGALSWHRNGVDLAISLASATSPSDVYSINTTTQGVTRWTTHETLQVDPAGFVEPQLVRWKSFDGRTISGFVYRAPAARFPGRRPVLVNIHGGPEGQFRPGFLARTNYLLNNMGISIVYPNVRGSSGYGKSFLKLDNGFQREDSVKDIGALLDWIATQPDLDASRVAVTGGSYGGYMSLAVATWYSERIAASIDIVGISNFVTFLERTESYRRDLRRAEYGDERDPAMRKFMEQIAPVNNASRIRKPLFVVQGKNDPRVPYQEADQIVAAVRKTGTPVWYMVAHDEGHGFAKKANADYQFNAGIVFLDRYLLGNGMAK